MNEDVPYSPLEEGYYRRAGGETPTRLQRQGAWSAVSQLYRVSSEPSIHGAYCAAEWTLEISDRRPIGGINPTPTDLIVYAEGGTSDVYGPATPAAVRDELVAARILLDRPPVDDPIDRHLRDYYEGVTAWLRWWAGTGALPAILCPVSDTFRVYMEQHERDASGQPAS